MSFVMIAFMMYSLDALTHSLAGGGIAQISVYYSAANMLENLTPYRSMSVNKGFYISKERA